MFKVHMFLGFTPRLKLERVLFYLFIFSPAISMRNCKTCFQFHSHHRTAVHVDHLPGGGWHENCSTIQRFATSICLFDCDISAYSSDITNFQATPQRPGSQLLLGSCEDRTSYRSLPKSHVSASRTEILSSSPLTDKQYWHLKHAIN